MVSVGLGMILRSPACMKPRDRSLATPQRHRGYNEDGLLQIIDLALSICEESIDKYDDFAQDHIPTGLEPLRLKECGRGIRGC